MTYFEINWLLFSKPGTNLFITGVNEIHVDILFRAMRDNLMLPILKMQNRFIVLRNESTITFLKAGKLDLKTRGYSKIRVVHGDDITEEKGD
jgi:hypothetical protein